MNADAKARLKILKEEFESRLMRSGLTGYYCLPLKDVQEYNKLAKAFSMDKIDFKK